MLYVREEVEMIGWIFKIVLFIGKEVIKEEVLKWLSFVVVVYIVVYGSVEIGEIVLVLNFIWKFWRFEMEDFFLIIIDVLNV